LECAENEVCQVGTEEGAAAACVGKYLITPKYQNPMFISPCICKG
jgi:hypothetical protein